MRLSRPIQALFSFDPVVIDGVCQADDTFFDLFRR
jgi:hypothetical protein